MIQYLLQNLIQLTVICHSDYTNAALTQYLIMRIQQAYFIISLADRLSKSEVKARDFTFSEASASALAIGSAEAGSASGLKIPNQSPDEVLR